MTAETVAVTAAAEPTAWDTLAVRAPLLAGTMRRYIAQQTVTLAPSTIQAINNTLVRFGLWVIEHDPTVRGAGNIDRSHIEAFKLKCITDVHFATGQPLSPNTIRQRLRLIKVFFDRIIDWEFDDAPRRNPIIRGDVPPRPEPLPKFLDDDAIAAFMHHAEIEPDPLRKLCVLLWRAPRCASVSSATWQPIPSSKSVTIIGSTCRSASSATTATSHSTRHSSN